MEKLKKEFKKSQHKFVQLDRTNTVAIYQKYLIIDKSQFPSSYEVFKIKVREECEFNNYNYPKTELMPSNEDFGRTAFSFKDKQKAFDCFEELKLDLKTKDDNVLDIDGFKLRNYPERNTCVVTKDGKLVKNPKSILVKIYCEKFNKPIEEVEEMTIKTLSKEIFENATV